MILLVALVPSEFVSWFLKVVKMGEIWWLAVEIVRVGPDKPFSLEPISLGGGLRYRNYDFVSVEPAINIANPLSMKWINTSYLGILLRLCKPKSKHSPINDKKK